MKLFKLANIDEDPDRTIMEVFFKPYHYTIFEDQLMVQVTVAREGGNLESAILVSLMNTLMLLGKPPGLVVNVVDSRSKPWSLDVGSNPDFTIN